MVLSSCFSCLSAWRRGASRRVRRPREDPENAVPGMASAGGEDDVGAFAGRVRHSTVGFPVGIGPHRAGGRQ